MDTQKSGTIGVFLVDDHEVVRTGLKSLLSKEADMDVIGEAATAGTAMSGIDKAMPDVLVLDVRLPDGNGIELCRQISNRFPAIKTIIFTSLADDASKQAAASAGAWAYLLKKARTDELISAIRQVNEGETLLGEVATLESTRSPGSLLAVLSSQERLVVHFVGQGMTNKQIAREMALAEKTVKNYVSNVLAKMGMTRRTEVASFIAASEARSEHLATPQSWDEAGLRPEPV